MSLAIYELAVDALSLLLTGTAIKIMDDNLDIPDQSAAWLAGDRSALPYSLLFFAGGAALNAATAISLFFAAYCLGMAFNLMEKMPSGLYGYQESLLVAVSGIAFFGWGEMAGSLFIIACIQLVDDLRDQQEDRWSGQKNLAQRFGRVEAGLLAAILFLATARVALAKAVLTLFGSRIISALFERYHRNEAERRVNYDF